MKHLFYIHTSITYFVAKGIIFKNKLLPNDVLFVLGRSYAGVDDKNYKTIDIDTNFNDLNNLPAFGYKRCYYDHIKSIKALDSEIRNIFGNENFTCYLPSDLNFLMQLLASHKSCICLHYIEEGLFSYNDKQRKVLYPFKGVFGWLRALVNINFRSIYYKLYLSDPTLYVLFDLENYISPLRLEKVPLLNTKNNSCDFTGNSILIMNAFRDANVNVLDSVYKIIEKFAISYKKDVIYVKTHPYSIDNINNSIIMILNKYINNVKTLPMDSNIESILVESNDLSIYGFFSASMLYAHNWKHSVWSFLNEFYNDSEYAQVYIEKNFPLPNIFKTKIKQIIL